MKHIIFYCDATGDNPFVHDILQVGFLVTDLDFVDVLSSYSTYIKPATQGGEIQDEFLVRAGMAQGGQDPHQELARRSVYWPPLEEALEKIFKGISRIVDIRDPEIVFCVWNADFDSLFLRRILMETQLVSAETFPPIRSLYHELLFLSALGKTSGKEVDLPPQDFSEEMAQKRTTTTSAIRKCEFLQELFRKTQKKARYALASPSSRKGKTKTFSKKPLLRRNQ